ncbi:LacI family DNA-binding transcriptional regulator [uncultured Cedecea sp.]|uniref:LacI family DNA-binding transcriptional regulator n=1 Tax=uncultured Cedecea sp. TaxID=988762 RepID=UPI00261B1F71|nr:LacI family DNA-binding transcriptional regulator [uncultured Cedecea sp.]
MANIIDIAKKTGLSASTVSRALSKPEKVAPLTQMAGGISLCWTRQTSGNL